MFKPSEVLKKKELESSLQKSEFNKQLKEKFANLSDNKADREELQRLQPKGDYLTTAKGDEKYQPKGEYALQSSLSDYQPAGDYLTSSEADEAYQPIGDYMSTEAADEKYQVKGEYATTHDLEGYQPVGDYVTSTQLSGYQPVGDYVTNAKANEKFQPKGEYLTATTADERYQTKGEYVTDEELASKVEEIKSDAASKYQPVGTYATSSELSAVKAKVDEVTSENGPSYEVGGESKTLKDVLNELDAKTKVTTPIDGKTDINEILPKLKEDINNIQTTGEREGVDTSSVYLTLDQKDGSSVPITDYDEYSGADMTEDKEGKVRLDKVIKDNLIPLTRNLPKGSIVKSVSGRTITTVNTLSGDDETHNITYSYNDLTDKPDLIDRAALNEAIESNTLTINPNMVKFKDDHLQYAISGLTPNGEKAISINKGDLKAGDKITYSFDVSTTNPSAITADSKITVSSTGDVTTDEVGSSIGFEESIPMNESNSHISHTVTLTEDMLRNNSWDLSLLATGEPNDFTISNIKIEKGDSETPYIVSNENIKGSIDAVKSATENITENYLTKTEATEKYQPKGEYITTEAYTADKANLITTESADEKYVAKTAYDTDKATLLTKTEAGETYVSKTDAEGKYVTSEAYTADKDTFLTKSNASSTYQPRGNYVTTDEYTTDKATFLTKEEAGTTYQPVGEYVTTETYNTDKAGLLTQDTADTRYQAAGDYLTTAKGDEKYQPKGEYVTNETYTADKATFATITASDEKYVAKTAYDTDKETLLTKEDAEGKYLTKSDAEGKYVTAESYNTDKDTFLTKSDAGTNYVSSESYATDKATFLTKSEATTTYQPIGDYVTNATGNERYVRKEDYTSDKAGLLTTESADEKYVSKTAYDTDKETFLTKTEASSTYQTAGDYLTTSAGDEKYQPKGNYVTTSDYNTDKSELLTKTEAGETYLGKTDAESTYVKTSDYTTDKEGLLTKTDAEEKYLTKTDASTTYQTAGNYVTSEAYEADKANLITTESADEKYVAKTAYDTDKETFLTKTDAEGKYVTSEDYTADKDTFLTKSDAGTTYVTSEAYNRDKSGLLTKTEASSTYQPAGEYVTSSEYTTDKDTFLTKTDAEGKYVTKADAGTNYVSSESYTTDKATFLTKEEAGTTYQPVGNYVTNETYTADKATFATITASDEKYVAKTAYDTDKATFATTEASDAKYVAKTAYDTDKATLLTKTEATEKYQPKGEYVTSESYEGDKETFLTKSEASTTYQPAGNYVTNATYTRDKATFLTQSTADTRYQASGNYVTTDTYNTDKAGLLTSEQAESTYVKTSDYTTDKDTFLTKTDAGTNYVSASTYATDKPTFLTKTEATTTYQPIGDYLTLAKGDEKYQPKGEYALQSALGDYQRKGEYVTAEEFRRYKEAHSGDESGATVPAGEYATVSELEEVKRDYATKTYTEGLVNNTYTKAESDGRFQPLGDYLTTTAASTTYQPVGNYVNASDYATDKDTFLTKTEAGSKYVTNDTYTADKRRNETTYATKTELGRYQPVGNYVTTDTYTTDKATFLTQDSADDRYVSTESYTADKATMGTTYATKAELKSAKDGAYTKAEADNKFVAKESYTTDKETFLTKTEASSTYQPVGSYATSSDLETLKGRVDNVTSENGPSYNVGGSERTLKDILTDLDAKSKVETAIDGKSNLNEIVPDLKEELTNIATTANNNADASNIKLTSSDTLKDYTQEGDQNIPVSDGKMTVADILEKNLIPATKNLSGGSVITDVSGRTITTKDIISGDTATKDIVYSYNDLNDKPKIINVKNNLISINKDALIKDNKHISIDDLDKAISSEGILANYAPKAFTVKNVDSISEHETYRFYGSIELRLSPSYRVEDHITYTSGLGTYYIVYIGNIYLKFSSAAGDRVELFNGNIEFSDTRPIKRLNFTFDLNSDQFSKFRNNNKELMVSLEDEATFEDTSDRVIFTDFKLYCDDVVSYSNSGNVESSVSLLSKHLKEYEKTVYTKTDADGRFQPVGNYLTTEAYNTDKDTFLTKTDASETYATKSSVESLTSGDNNITIGEETKSVKEFITSALDKSSGPVDVNVESNNNDIWNYDTYSNLDVADSKVALDTLVNKTVLPLITKLEGLNIATYDTGASKLKYTSLRNGSTTDVPTPNKTIYYSDIEEAPELGVFEDVNLFNLVEENIVNGIEVTKENDYKIKAFPVSLLDRNEGYLYISVSQLSGSFTATFVDNNGNELREYGIGNETIDRTGLFKFDLNVDSFSGEAPESTYLKFTPSSDDDTIKVDNVAYTIKHPFRDKYIFDNRFDFIRKHLKSELAKTVSADNVYTKTDADGRFQPIGNYLTTDVYNTDKPTFLTKTDAASTYLTTSAYNSDKETLLTKSEAIEKYQPKGEYVTNETYTADKASLLTKAEAGSTYVTAESYNTDKATFLTTTAAEDKYVTNESYTTDKDTFLTKTDAESTYVKTSDYTTDKDTFLTKTDASETYATKSSVDALATGDNEITIGSDTRSIKSFLTEAIEAPKNIKIDLDDNNQSNWNYNTNEYIDTGVDFRHIGLNDIVNKTILPFIHRMENMNIATYDSASGLKSTSIKNNTSSDLRLPTPTIEYRDIEGAPEAALYQPINLFHDVEENVVNGMTFSKETGYKVKAFPITTIDGYNNADLHIHVSDINGTFEVKFVDENDTEFSHYGLSNALLNTVGDIKFECTPYKYDGSNHPQNTYLKLIPSSDSDTITIDGLEYILKHPLRSHHFDKRFDYLRNHIKAELAKGPNTDSIYTKTEADGRFQPLGEYLTVAAAATKYQPVGNYVTSETYTTDKETFLTKTEASTTYQPTGDYLTTASGDEKYQPKGEYATTAQLNAKATELINDAAGKYATTTDFETLKGRVDNVTSENGPTYNVGGSDRSLKEILTDLDSKTKVETAIDDKTNLNEIVPKLKESIDSINTTVSNVTDASNIKLTLDQNDGANVPVKDYTASPATDITEVESGKVKLEDVVKKNLLPLTKNLAEGKVVTSVSGRDIATKDIITGATSTDQITYSYNDLTDKPSVVKNNLISLIEAMIVGDREHIDINKLDNIINFRILASKVRDYVLFTINGLGQNYNPTSMQSCKFYGSISIKLDNTYSKTKEKVKVNLNSTNGEPIRMTNDTESDRYTISKGDSKNIPIMFTADEDTMNMFIAYTGKGGMSLEVLSDNDGTLQDISDQVLVTGFEIYSDELDSNFNGINPEVSVALIVEHLKEYEKTVYTKAQSDEKYQLKGNYLTTEAYNTDKSTFMTQSDADGRYVNTDTYTAGIAEIKSNYLSTDAASKTYQPKGTYLTRTTADTVYQPLGNYVTTSTYTTDKAKAVTSENMVQKLTDAGYIDKTTSDGRYQLKGEYITQATGDTRYVTSSAYETDKASFITQSTGDTRYVTSSAYNTDKDTFLTKDEAGTTYQPVGNYVTEAVYNAGKEDLVNKINDVKAKYQLAGNYITAETAQSTYQPIGNYIDEVSGDSRYVTKTSYTADKDTFLTKTAAREKYQPLGNYVTQDAFTTGTANFVTNSNLTTTLEDYLAKSDIDEELLTIGYKKETELDKKYQPKGEYVTTSTYNDDKASLLTKGEASTTYATQTALSSANSKIEALEIEDTRVNNAKLDKTEAAKLYQTKGAYLTRDIADPIYQPIGNYVNTSVYTSDKEAMNAKFNTSAIKFDLDQNSGASVPIKDYTASTDTNITEVETGKVKLEDIIKKNVLPATKTLADGGVVKEVSGRTIKVGKYDGSTESHDIVYSYNDLTDKPDLSSTNFRLNEAMTPISTDRDFQREKYTVYLNSGILRKSDIVHFVIDLEADNNTGNILVKLDMDQIYSGTITGSGNHKIEFDYTVPRNSYEYYETMPISMEIYITNPDDDNRNLFDAGYRINDVYVVNNTYKRTRNVYDADSVDMVVRNAINVIDQILHKYLTIRNGDEKYQPKGEYATTAQLNSANTVIMNSVKQLAINTSDPTKTVLTITKNDDSTENLEIPRFSGDYNDLRNKPEISNNSNPLQFVDNGVTYNWSFRTVNGKPEIVITEAGQ